MSLYLVRQTLIYKHISLKTWEEIWHMLHSQMHAISNSKSDAEMSFVEQHLLRPEPL